jgi:hypothetical protein
MNCGPDLQNFCRKMKLRKSTACSLSLVVMFGAGASYAACVVPQRPFVPTDESSKREFEELIRSDFEKYIAAAQHYFQCLDVERQRVFEEAREVTQEYDMFLKAVGKD